MSSICHKCNTEISLTEGNLCIKEKAYNYFRRSNMPSNDQTDLLDIGEPMQILRQEQNNT